MNLNAVLLIKVIPKSHANAIIGWENEVLKIRLQASPIKGEANQELIRFLAKVLKLPQRNIIIVKGEMSRLKKIIFEGITQEELHSKIAMHL